MSEWFMSYAKERLTCGSLNDDKNKYTSNFCCELFILKNWPFGNENECFPGPSRVCNVCAQNVGLFEFCLARKKWSAILVDI